MQNILSGHKITNPLLVGIKTPGQLGGTQELQTSFSIYNSQVINPLKSQLLESFNMIGKIKGCSELMVETVAPIEFTFSEQIMIQILSTDEMREIIGYQPASAAQQNNDTTNDN